MLNTFLPRDGMRCAVLVILILSVRLSHSWTVSTWPTITISSPYGSPMIVVFFRDIRFIPRFEGVTPSD